MASARPIKLPPRRSGLAAITRRQNLPTLGLVAVAVALAALIGHDIFFPSSPNLAAALSDRLVLLGDGAVVADGPPGEVLRPEVFSEVYGLAMGRVDLPGGAAPLLYPEAMVQPPSAP